jgi:hypothetical protein
MVSGLSVKVFMSQCEHIFAKLNNINSQVNQSLTMSSKLHAFFPVFGSE